MSSTAAAATRPTVSRASIVRTGLLACAGALVTRPASASATTTVPPSLAVGAWSVGMDADPSVLTATERRLAARLTIASIFRGKGDVWPYPQDVALGRTRTLLVAWSLEDWGSYAWWASGRGDAVVRDQARRLRAYGRPVVLRPWAEMNADWVAYQVRPAGHAQAPRGGTPAQFVAAWRRVVSIVRAEGARNVRWAFTPTTDTYAGTTDVRTFFPGTAFVDVLGLDGYNWGTGGRLRWRTFDDVYHTQYGRLVGLAPGHPVWICEISCADPASTQGDVRVTAPSGATKGGWWLDTFARLDADYSHVRAAVLFDVVKERDWRTASSAPALSGLRTALAHTRRLVR